MTAAHRTKQRRETERGIGGEEKRGRGREEKRRGGGRERGTERGRERAREHMLKTHRVWLNIHELLHR
jgi:hypothetical protein